MWYRGTYARLWNCLCLKASYISLVLGLIAVFLRNSVLFESYDFKYYLLQLTYFIVLCGKSSSYVCISLFLPNSAVILFH